MIESHLSDGRPRAEGSPIRPDLATAPTGVPLRVGTVLFEVVRSRCRQLGIRTGIRLRCVKRTEEDVHVRLPDGREVTLPLEHARFVKIAAEPDQAALSGTI